MAIDMNPLNKSVLWDQLRMKRTFRTLLRHRFPFSLRVFRSRTSFQWRGPLESDGPFQLRHQ
jgi:hypothetical protein